LATFRAVEPRLPSFGEVEVDHPVAEAVATRRGGLAGGARRHRCRGDGTNHGAVTPWPGAELRSLVRLDPARYRG
jgi:hypothetical protein